MPTGDALTTSEWSTILFLLPAMVRLIVKLLQYFKLLCLSYCNLVLQLLYSSLDPISSNSFLQWLMTNLVWQVPFNMFNMFSFSCSIYQIFEWQRCPNFTLRYVHTYAVRGGWKIYFNTNHYMGSHMRGRGAEAGQGQNPLSKKWVQHPIFRIRFETTRSKPSLSSRNGRSARVSSTYIGTYPR